MLRPLSFRRSKLFLVVLAASASFAIGCQAPDDSSDTSGEQAINGKVVAGALEELVGRFRNADIAKTGGFSRSFASHLNETVAAAGEDLAAQRDALKGIFGVDLPQDIAPKQFVESFQKAFDLQFAPVLENGAGVVGATTNLAHVDSMVADVLETFPDIVKNLRAAGIPEERAMDLLLAVGWHDVGKAMTPEFVLAVPRVKELLSSPTYLNALSKIPEGARDAFQKKFIIGILCHEFGSLKALGEQGGLEEGAAQRILSFIEDHNDGSGNRAAWWNEQWEQWFGVTYGTPKTSTGFLLAALDRARQGSIEMLENNGVRKLDGGIIKIAYQSKNTGKTLGFAIQDSVVLNNGKSLGQLTAMAESKVFGELLLTKFEFFKKALRRNQITSEVMKSFVVEADPAKDVVVILDQGKQVTVDNLDTFFAKLDENWDSLYGDALLRMTP